MRRRRIKFGWAGFTIVEILVVVVIIVLIASVGGGVYVGTYKKTLVEKSARNFLLVAKYARILAIERQSRCRIKLDVANNGFMLIIDEFNDQTGQTEQVIVRDLYFKPTKFRGEVEFENVRVQSAGLEQVSETEQQNIINFSPDGTAQSAVIQIGDGKNHLTVSISAVTGKVKVYQGTADNVKSDTIDLDEQQAW